jgi:hypothetical protein
MMQLWVVLAGVMFFAQCAMRAQPYWRVIMGKQKSAESAPPPQAPR